MDSINLIQYRTGLYKPKLNLCQLKLKFTLNAHQINIHLRLTFNSNLCNPVLQNNIFSIPSYLFPYLFAHVVSINSNLHIDWKCTHDFQNGDKVTLLKYRKFDIC